VIESAPTRAFESFFPVLTMAKQSIAKLVSVWGLGFLVLVFGFALLLIAAPLFLPNGIFGFAFAISTRAFTALLVCLVALIAAGLFSIARALRRRHLH
jgi:uncharacterized membrane protein (DUF2068 family)